MKRPDYKTEIKHLLHKKHKTAEEVFEGLQSSYPQVGRATIYRHLEALSEAGEIAKVLEQGGNTFYEYNNDPHIHFLDLDTHELRDFPQEWIESHIPPDFEIVDIIIKGRYIKSL